MIAALPMYDWPQIADSTDSLWAGIRNRLRARGWEAPENLSRADSIWDMWRSPDLVFAQTCGMPYRTVLHGHVELVGTPDYGLPDVPPGYYYSEIIVRADEPGELADFIGRTLAVNDHHSQSGWAAPQNHAAALGLPPFTRVLHTKAHRDSARAVAEGRADIAAIDAVTWRLLTQHMPDLAARLRVLGQTEPTPGLPYITAQGRDARGAAEAAAQAIAELGSKDRARLGLRGLAHIPAAAYLAVPTPAPPSHVAPAV